MRLLEINSVCGIRSTGRIAVEIAEEYQKKGFETVIAYGRESVPAEYVHLSKRIGSETSVRINALESRVLDNDGFTAKKTTKKFLDWADAFDPDVLWLHNLHGYYINIELLFKWIKTRQDMKVKWLLHDCWSFTGHCSYFSYAGCNKWKSHCEQCIQKSNYPSSYLLDRSFCNFEKKRELFTACENLTIVTPSEWLAKLVKESFLKNYPIEIRNNRIDLKVFRHVESDIKKRFRVEGKKIVLGVAAQWQPAKGYQDFFKLRDLLSDEFAIVMVGLSDTQMKELPSSIVGIKRTNNVQELVELYSAADIFFNPTYEDNYPSVNLEAKACGTPVITYNSGGSPESVPPENVFNQGDLDSVVSKIKEIVFNK